MRKIREIKILSDDLKQINLEKENGVVYTPFYIINIILDHLNYQTNIYNKKIIDPACGEGNFLIIVVERFLKDCLNNHLPLSQIKQLLQNNIYGFDIDKNAIEKCIYNLNRTANNYKIQNIQWNISCQDSLNKEKVKKYFNFFDFVVGNPPYIRIQHLGQNRRNQIQKNWEFCKNGSTDMFIAFFELGLKLLNEEGQLGFITPNTFFKTKTAQYLRWFLMENKLIKKIIDFNDFQVFKKVSTYSAITILSKNWKQNKFYYFKGDKDGLKLIDEINLSNLNYEKWILGSNEVLKRIKEIENRGTPLYKIAKIHVGLSTLADDYYIFQNPIFEKDKAIIKLKDNREFIIEKNILKPIVKVSVLKSSNENQNRFIIFPYKKINDKYKIIPEIELKKVYPLTYQYFLAIKSRLLMRDAGQKKIKPWYAFGRTQGLDTLWGKKILFSPLNFKPNFIVWEKEDFVFYSGYCIKFDGDLHWLANQLNSKDMEFYIKYVGRDFQNGYKAYSKSFIANFGIVGYKNPIQPSLF